MIAKGGITSSDVASKGLQIRHAIVRGPMLPGIPYVVFPGNVGDDQPLLDVVRTLTATS